MYYLVFLDMKKTVGLIFLCVLFFCTSTVTAQIVTGRQKNSTKTVSVAKSPFKNARKGGRNTLPRGVQDKFLNIGFGLGIANPGMDLKFEQNAGMGYTAHLYQHILFKGQPTLGAGLYISQTFLPVNKSTYTTRFKHLEAATTPPWAITSVMASGLFNFTLQERVSAQIITNAGIVLASVPKTTALYYDTLLIPSLGYVRKDYSYSNISFFSVGWSAGFLFQFLYALRSNIEAKAGFEWQYMRIKYNREWTLPEPKTEQMLQQFRLLNFHIGIAFSF